MSCNLVLQNFQGTCHPGDTISGHLVCTFLSRENVRAVIVKLCGIEHTDWDESEYFYDNRAMKFVYGDVHYTGDNAFLDMELTLLKEETMAPGRYEYPFTFTLPRNLPMTFQGCHGYTKYFIKGTVDLTFSFSHEDKRYFNMQAPIDFNDMRSELQMGPCSYQEEKTICCCYCTSGTILLDEHLEKEAFVLGEVAKIKIDVINSTNEHIEEIKVTLKLLIKSKATNPRTSYKYETGSLATNSYTGVGAYGRRSYELDFEIPSSAVITNLIRCTLLKQWFVLKVEAVVHGCNSNMELETGVMIGHIPLADGTQSRPQQQISDASSAIPVGPFPSPTRSQRWIPDNQPTQYSDASDKKPPYPVGPSKFPLPSLSPGQIGFSLAPSSGVPDRPILPSGRMPLVPVHSAPYPPGPGFSVAAANAPPAKYLPSAPNQAEMADEGDSLMIDVEDRSCGSSELPPPPSYSDAVSASFARNVEDVYPPDIQPSGHANHNGSSARRQK